MRIRNTALHAIPSRFLFLCQHGSLIRISKHSVQGHKSVGTGLGASDKKFYFSSAAAFLVKQAEKYGQELATLSDVGR
jgi:hypothetical protein